jgi:hypothetical protein
MNELWKGQVSISEDVFQPWHVFHVLEATAVLNFVDFQELPKIVRGFQLHPSRDVQLVVSQ